MSYFQSKWAFILSIINPELQKSFLLFVVKTIAEACLPGGALLIGLTFRIFSPAMAAGPSDWMRGDPNEGVLRRTDKQIKKVAEELDNIAAQTVENAQQFNLNLPGTTTEEKITTIRSILEHDLDGIDLNKRLKRIRNWLKPSEIGNAESEFWVQVVDQISKLFP